MLREEQNGISVETAKVQNKLCGNLSKISNIAMIKFKYGMIIKS